MTDIKLAGTPERVTEVLRGIIGQGAQNFADAPRPEGTQLFAAAVLPHLD
jgi:hypothetical protein